MLAYDEDLAYIHDVSNEFAVRSAPGVLELLHQSGIWDGLVVDLGCGPGYWAAKLADAGYDVIGVDFSSAMIARAIKKAPTVDFLVGSFLDFQFPKCRGVTALGEILSYRFDERNNARSLRRFLRRVYAALDPGGVLIFDVAEPGRHRGTPLGLYEGKDWTILSEFLQDEQHERLTRRIILFRKLGKLFRRSEETHELQLYRSSTVAKMLREIGFRVRITRKYGDYQLLPSLVAFVARKP